MKMNSSKAVERIVKIMFEEMKRHWQHKVSLYRNEKKTICF